VTQEDVVVQLVRAVVDRDAHGVPRREVCTGDLASDVDRAVVDVQQGLSCRAAAERGGFGVVQEREHDALRAVDAEQRADPGERPVHLRDGLPGLAEHCVELVDPRGHLPDRGIRVDRTNPGVQVGDDLLGGGRDLGCLAQRGEVETAGRRIATKSEIAEQHDGRVDDLGRDLVDPLGDHAHRAEVLADDRYRLADAPERLRRRFHGSLSGCREPLRGRLELIEGRRLGGRGGLELVDRSARLLEVGAHRHRVGVQEPGRDAAADEQEGQHRPDDGVHDAPRPLLLGARRGARSTIEVVEEVVEGHESPA
jgi:hypothetical protein